MPRLSCRTIIAASVLGSALLAGCSSIPTSGPSKSQIEQASGASSPAGIQIVGVTDEVARKLLAERGTESFSSALGNSTAFQQQLGIGDVIEVSIWEAP